MPLWKIYHPVGAYSREDKQALSQAITAPYARMLPRFYVGVIFQEVAEDSFFIGGEPRNNFVRIWVDHIARSFPDAASGQRFMQHMTTVFAPWTSDRGLDWELHIDETPFALWTIQGYEPPLPGSADSERWRADNHPSPRTPAPETAGTV